MLHAVASWRSIQHGVYAADVVPRVHRALCVSRHGFCDAVWGPPVRGMYETYSNTRQRVRESHPVPRCRERTPGHHLDPRYHLRGSLRRYADVALRHAARSGPGCESPGAGDDLQIGDSGNRLWGWQGGAPGRCPAGQERASLTRHGPLCGRAGRPVYYWRGCRDNCRRYAAGAAGDPVRCRSAAGRQQR